MLVTRTSMVSGEENTLHLDITQEQMDAYLAGEYLQKAFPNLTAAQREFIHTGTTEKEWNEVFAEEIEEKEDNRTVIARNHQGYDPEDIEPWDEDNGDEDMTGDTDTDDYPSMWRDWEDVIG